MSNELWDRIFVSNDLRDFPEAEKIIKDDIRAELVASLAERAKELKEHMETDVAGSTHVTISMDLYREISVFVAEIAGEKGDDCTKYLRADLLREEARQWLDEFRSEDAPFIVGELRHHRLLAFLEKIAEGK